MESCSVLNQTALVVFIVAMVAIIYAVYQINMTLFMLRSFAVNIKSIAKNNIEFSFYSFLAKLLGIRTRGGD